MWVCNACNAENTDLTTICHACSARKGAKKPILPSQGNKAQLNDAAAKSRRDTLRKKINIEKYVQTNPLANTLSSIAGIYLALSVVISITTFFAIRNFTQSIWYGLIAAIASLGLYILPGLLLMAIASIWQNTQETSQLIRYQIDKAEVMEEAIE